MYSFGKNILTAALVVGFFLCALGAIDAPAQTTNFMPPGSYQKTCNEITIDGAVITATCKTKAKAAMQWKGTMLKDFFECDGDISNNNGDLECARNPNSALMQKAKTVMDESYTKIYGRDPGDLTYAAGYQRFLREMFKKGLAKAFYAGNLGTAFPYNANVFFTERLNAPENANLKKTVSERVIQNVYGMPLPPEKFALYNSIQTFTYEKGYQTEREILFSNERQLSLIYRMANAFALGLDNSEEANGKNSYKKYDGPKKTYSEWIEYYKQGLYSPDSPQLSKMLPDVIRRAFKKKNPNAAPTDEQINQAIIKFTKTKAIYQEMLASL